MPLNPIHDAPLPGYPTRDAYWTRLSPSAQTTALAIGLALGTALMTGCLPGAPRTPRHAVVSPE